MTRREALKLCGRGFCLFAASSLFNPPLSQAQGMKKGLIRTKLSPYFAPLEGGMIRCELCPHQCRVPRGRRGICRVRENRGGKYFSLVYGNPCALHLDPIERNPFFHVLPGTNALSVATAGCNFKCKFCETWEVSQASPEDIFSYDIPGEQVVSKAKDMKARSIAYTYTEPTVFFEFMSGICSFAKKAGLLNVYQSNGFINPKPLGELCNHLDAANIDLKGFTEAFYREICDGHLAPVLETIKTLKQRKIHIEITNIIIPTKNDDISGIREMCLWLKRELGTETPLHFSRFYPLYKLRALPSTPVSMLERARDEAMSIGHEYVYIAKVPGHEGENTFCPKCKKMIIQRTGFMVGEIHLKAGKCKFCGKPVPGIWA
jgi:pyruvate formate lyase activating enzyme